MTAGIYQIRNMVTGWTYLGQTAGFADRFRRHRQGLSRGKHANRSLLQDWRAHGPDAAQIGKKLSPKARATLLSFSVGRQHSAEARAKNRAAHLGRKHTAEARAKIAARRGWHHSEETKAKISATKRARKA